MPSLKKKAAAPGWVLRLYVVGDSPKSMLARENLDAICRERADLAISVEVVDILDDPLRGLKDGITATPALVRVSPLPAVTALGDLVDRAKALHSLGLGRAEAPVRERQDQT